MANVIGTKRRLTCVAPVQNVHGYLGNTGAMSKGAGVVDNDVRYGGAAKVYGFTRSYGTRNFFGVRTKTHNVFTTTEKQQAAILRQNKFRSVVLAAHERYTDPTKKLQDQANFKAQTKYATMLGYLFALEWEAYEG